MTAYLLGEVAAALRSAPEWFPPSLADRTVNCRNRWRSGPVYAPLPLGSDDRADIAEAVRERAAIQEYDGALARGEAERRARTAMRVFRYRLVDDPDQWVVLIAPGCDLTDAECCCRNRFGPGRVIEVQWHGKPPGAHSHAKSRGRRG